MHKDIYVSVNMIIKSTASAHIERILEKFVYKQKRHHHHRHYKGKDFLFMLMLKNVSLLLSRDVCSINWHIA